MEMKMKFVNLVMCLVLASSAALLAQSQSQKAKLSFDQAQKIALEREPGKIVSRELEKEHGKLIYSFDIRTANGLHEVNVDAMTGNVIGDKIETAAEEAKEKQQDARKSKKESQTAPQKAGGLGPNLHLGPHRNQLPDLFDLRVGHGDASIGPVSLPVQRAKISKRFCQAMDHDCPARPRTQLARLLLVCCAGIRNMQRHVKLALGVPGVDDVIAFGRLVVALHALRPHRHGPQSDFVRLQDFLSAQQGHGTRGLDDDDLVGLQGVGGG
jgi:hypothetical protein